MTEVWGGAGGGSPAETPDQLEHSISQGGLPGGGYRDHIAVSCLCMLSSPHGVSPACPVTTFLSQRLIYAPKVQAQRRKTPTPNSFGSVSFGFRLLGGLMFSQSHLNENISSTASLHSADHSRSMSTLHTEPHGPGPALAISLALRASVSSSMG